MFCWKIKVCTLISVYDTVIPVTFSVIQRKIRIIHQQKMFLFRAQICSILGAIILGFATCPMISKLRDQLAHENPYLLKVSKNNIVTLVHVSQSLLGQCLDSVDYYTFVYIRIIVLVIWNLLCTLAINIQRSSQDSSNTKQSDTDNEHIKIH